MKILITGICGFVGSRLAESIAEYTAPGTMTIAGIDNLSRNGSWLNRERLSARGIRVYHGDVRNASDMEDIDPFDWVIDAAANPSVLAGKAGNTTSRQLVEHNLAGTINLLEICKRWKAGLILLSTSRVYSIPPLANLDVEVHNQAFQPRLSLQPSSSKTNPDHLPGMSSQGISECFPTSAPVSLYGATKLASEAIALEYGHAFDFPVWINRCGVMAGARQFGKPDQGIFAFWIHSWREGRPLKYLGFDGMGHQVRDCLHPRDLASLILRQCGHCSSSTCASTPTLSAPQIVNVSGGLKSAMSLRQLSAWCAERFPHSATSALLESHPNSGGKTAIANRPYDLPWLVLDHSLATKAWDWKPQMPCDVILEEIASFAAGESNWISVSA